MAVRAAVLRRLGALTAYEVLARRFGVRVKHVVAVALPRHAAARRGRARVRGLPRAVGASSSVALPALPHLWLWSIVCVGVLTLVYTFEGGIAAVIWTDVVQLAIYIAGSLCGRLRAVALDSRRLGDGRRGGRTRPASCRSCRFRSIRRCRSRSGPGWPAARACRWPRTAPTSCSSSGSSRAGRPRRPAGARRERRRRLRAVRAVPARRRDAVRVLPVPSAAADHDERRDLSGVHRPAAAAWRLRPRHRRDLRGGDVEPECVAERAGARARSSTSTGRRRARRRQSLGCSRCRVRPSSGASCSWRSRSSRAAGARSSRPG